MARIFMDGFELGDSSLWTTTSGATIVSSNFPAGFSGTYYLVCDYTGFCDKYLSANKSELYFAFKYYPKSNQFSGVLISFRDSATTCTMSIVRNLTSNYLEARLGMWGTLCSTGTTILQLNKVYLIEIYYKPLNSGGVITVKIDGIQQFSYSGDTTNGLEEIRSFRIGSDGTTYNAHSLFDDFVVDDSNWIGNTKLGIIVPEGTGTTNNWTASAGNAWDCLNEKPPSDTDYVSSNTVNQIATYAMTTIANMSTIKAVQLQGRAAYESSPTPTHIQLGVRASAADYFATDLSPGVGFGMLSKILELNPADSAAWEQADIDGLEVGVKATA